MTKNSKPILSILIDEGKRAKFADLARRNSLSMSYLVNQAIDRMLETDSIDSSVGTSVGTSAGSSIEAMAIEELVKSYVDTYNSSVVSMDEVKRLIASSKNELLGLIPSAVPTLETIKAEINSSIAPIEVSIGELEASTQSQFEAMREELKKPLAIVR